MGTLRYMSWRRETFTMLDNQQDNAVTPRRVWNMMPTVFRECPILHEVIESHCRKVTGQDDSTMCDISQEMLDDLYSAIKEKACEVQPFDRNNLLVCRSRVGETCLVYMVRLRQV